MYLWAVINSEARDVLFCFDTNSHLWSKPIVSGTIPVFSHHSGHSNCVINDVMYMFGGYDENSGLYSQDVYKFDMKFFKWSYVPTKVIQDFSNFLQIFIFSCLYRGNHRCNVKVIRPRQSIAACLFMEDVELKDNFTTMEYKASH